GFPVLGFGWGFPAWGWGSPVASFGFGAPVWGFGWGSHFDWDRGSGWGGRFGGVQAFSVFNRGGRSAFIGTHAGWTGGRFAGNSVRAGFGDRAAGLRGGFANSRMGAAGNMRAGAFGRNSAFGGNSSGGNSKMGIFGGTRAGAIADSRQ